MKLAVTLLFSGALGTGSAFAIPQSVYIDISPTAGTATPSPGYGAALLSDGHGMTFSGVLWLDIGILEPGTYDL